MGISITKVRDSGLVASFFLPSTPRKHPGVIVIGGSEGGIDSTKPTARLLAEQGYAALALAYFKFEQLPQKLEEIPLEYFKQAIDWMASNALVESSRIGLIGTSKGGEAALLVSSAYPEISAVVAYVPSHVVFESINQTWSRKRVVKSSWTLHGDPLPFVPYQYSFRLMWRHGFLLGIYLGSLQNRESVEHAIIPVEQISGPVLLISGKNDALWPSSIMCAHVTERLAQHSFAFSFQHLSYDNVGHISPGVSQAATDKQSCGEQGFSIFLKKLFPRLIKAGGTKTGNALAKDDAWTKVCDFLEQHLKQ